MPCRDKVICLTPVMVRVTYEMGIETDLCYELVRDARRRAILSVLDPTGPPVALADLARQVAAHEMDETLETVTGGPQVRRTYISLSHVHVPKLADAGVVSFDADRQTVAASSEFDTVRSLVKSHSEILSGACD